MTKERAKEAMLDHVRKSEKMNRILHFIEEKANQGWSKVTMKPLSTSQVVYLREVLRYNVEAKDGVWTISWI